MVAQASGKEGSLHAAQVGETTNTTAMVESGGLARRPLMSLGRSFIRKAAAAAKPMTKTAKAGQILRSPLFI
jgi:hypothetical protein